MVLTLLRPQPQPVQLAKRVALPRRGEQQWAARQEKQQQQLRAFPSTHNSRTLQAVPLQGRPLTQ